MRPEKSVFVSAYADASWHPDEKAGGWAMWGRDGERRILASGPSPDWADNPDLNELCAVAAAVTICCQRLAVADATILVVKTDSQSVCQWLGWVGGRLRSGRLPKKEEALELVRRTLVTAHEHGLKLIAKWVKGHRGHVDTMAYLNDRVDDMARKARISRRSTFWMVEIGSKGAPIHGDLNEESAPWIGIAAKEQEGSP